MGTNSDPDEFIRQKTFAIIGASNNRNKYGNIVFHNLRLKGYTVFPVNPHLTDVDGIPCYPDIASLPAPVDGIVTVVPPPVTEKIVRESSKAGIKRVWMQQGSESPDAIRFCEEQGMNTVHDKCIMVATNYLPFFKKQ